MRIRSIVLAVFAVPVLIVLAVVFGARDNASESGASVNRALGAGIPVVVQPPDPEFTRTMFAVATIETVDQKIDECRGPVAVPLGSTQPILVAEHDYCGGSAWISRLEIDEAVSLNGPGLDEGLYVATELKTVARGNATVADLPQTDIVLQTCISKTEMVLVGLTEFGTGSEL